MTAILFVDNQVDDFVRYRSALAHAVLDQGWDVHVALPDEPGLDAIAADGMRAHVFPLDRFSVAPLVELRSIASLVRLYRRLRPDLVHHFSLKPALYGGIAARIASVPAVSTLTGLGHLFTADPGTSPIMRRLVIAGLRYAGGAGRHVLVVQNAEDRRRLAGWGIGGDGSTELVAGSGIDLSVFHPVPEPPGTPVVLMAGRLLREKGVGDFVAAATELRRGGVDARFVLAGAADEGHPSAIHRATVDGWRAAGVVECLGWQREMPGLIGLSSVVCLPSSYGEGIPRVLAEAAACGRPVVATDIAGCREVVEHGGSGVLVPVGDPDALAGALRRLLDDPSLRESMGARAHELAETRLSQDHVIDRTLSLYRRVLACG
jgi:glycosyltransferase involved in cell wall biosynthesis